MSPHAIGPRGRKIVLAASTSESSEYRTSTWRQMLLGTLPARFTKFPFYMIDVKWENEVREDGQAVAVPNGLRVVESILLQKFKPEDIAVCHTDQLDLFVGEDTRVVGIHAHNPLGIAFATDVYVQIYGRKQEPINAAEFRRLATHPVLKKTQRPPEGDRWRPGILADREKETAGRMGHRHDRRRRSGRDHSPPI